MNINSYKDYWVYKNLVTLGYKLKILKTKVEIRFPDGDLYEGFKIKKYEEGYAVYLYDGTFINEDLEFTSTYDEVVCSILYFFSSRY